MSNEAVSGLRAYRAHVSVSKREAVVAAIDAAFDQQDQLTVSSIARRAGVSREFIHSHADLRDRVREYSERQAEAQRGVRDGQADLQAGRIADRSTLMVKVLRQRQQIAALNDRVEELQAARARYLGEQLTAMDAAPRMDAQEAMIERERLAAENERLRREVEESARLIERLRNELAGARQALAESMRGGASVAPARLTPRGGA